jgi:hypothetical protein
MFSISDRLQRWQHFTAMVLIGDGVMALIHPRKDALAWRRGPAAWQRLMTELHERPALTRVIGALQLAGGIAWALQQEQRRRRF